MVDLLGPNAFGASNPAATRPAATPANSGADTFFANCTTPAAEDGTEIDATWANAVLAQVRGAIRGGQVVENNSDDLMLARALRSHKMNFVSASAVGGTANAVTLAFSPAFDSLADLVSVPLRFLVEATNTAGITIAVDGLAAQAVTWPDGTALAAGDLAIGALVEIAHDGTAFRFQTCLSPSQVRAAVRLQKSPFNLSQAVFEARQALSGTGFVSYQTGVYTKQSATSNLIISLSTNAFTSSAAAAAFLRMTGLPSNFDIIVSNSDASQTRSAANGTRIYAGMPAGAVNWTLLLGRNDATAWSSIINPNNTDGSSMPSITTTSVLIQEIEP
jgi:hypothetical protein